MDRIPSTPYPELLSVLIVLLSEVRTVLAGNFVGAYLVGSLATGDFDIDSDVDFLVLTNSELTEREVRSLQAMHADIHSLDCYPAKHLEGSYISKDLLNRAEAVGVEPLWYLDNGSTLLARSIHDNQWHVRWVLRERAIQLAGADPKRLIKPIPVDALRMEMAVAMDKLDRHFAAEMDQPLAYFNTRFGQSFTVLTCCRILHTLRTGVALIVDIYT